MNRLLRELVVAFQFLTRLPMPPITFDPGDLPRSTKLFPVVGLAIGFGASLLMRLLAPHLDRLLTALLVLVFLVMATGAFHEDGLADSADGFGGGWKREQVLTIMRDSRIGSYGALALALSLLARLLLLAALPTMRWTAIVLSAQVLCRWTTLPLSYCMPPARQEDGQGSRVAQRVPLNSLVIGTLFTAAVLAYALRAEIWKAALASIAVTTLSGIYYFRRIGGVTGDCFGATNQLTEIAVYLCGVWH